MNARRILEVLRDHGPCSRADLMRRSGISAPTVSKVITNLVDSGLVEEGDAARPSIGRPGRLLQLASRTTRVLGIALDARRSWFVVAGFDGTFPPEQLIAIDTPDSYDALLEAIAAAAQPWIEDPDATVLGLGISAPGLVDATDERIVLSPNLPSTNGRSPARDLAGRLAIDCVLLQEANAHCLGERMFGAARGRDHFGVLDVSTGMGLGVMVDGALLTGSRGFAGELGHVTIDKDGLRCGCGKRGCLETLATDSALARSLSARLRRPVEPHTLLADLQAHATDAAADIEQTSTYLAIAMAMVVNVFNPTALYVHGRFLDARDDLFDRVRQLTREHALAPPLHECHLARTTTTKVQGAIAGILHHLTDSQGPRLR